MTDTNQATSTSIEQWTSVQAYVLAVICLLVGLLRLVHSWIARSGNRRR